MVHNKCDLAGTDPGLREQGLKGNDPALITLSAKSGAGMALLRDHLKHSMGFQGAGEGGFTARRRHLHERESEGRDRERGVPAERRPASLRQKSLP